jgi:hypothetical protein
MKLARVDKVVLDRIAGPPHYRSLEPGDGLQQRLLHIARQRGQDAVRVDRVVVEPFRLKKNLVPLQT